MHEKGLTMKCIKNYCLVFCLCLEFGVQAADIPSGQDDEEIQLRRLMQNLAVFEVDDNLAIEEDNEENKCYYRNLFLTSGLYLGAFFVDFFFLRDLKMIKEIEEADAHKEIFNYIQISFVLDLLSQGFLFVSNFANDSYTSFCRKEVLLFKATCFFLSTLNLTLMYQKLDYVIKSEENNRLSTQDDINYYYLNSLNHLEGYFKYHFILRFLNQLSNLTYSFCKQNQRSSS